MVYTQSILMFPLCGQPDAWTTGVMEGSTEDEVTAPQAAQHCSSAAVWFGVTLPVIGLACIASPCDTVQRPNMPGPAQ